MKYFFGPGLSTNITWFVEADVYGGAIAAVQANATSFAHRDAFLVYQLYANTASKLPPYPSDGVPFVDNMLSALEPNATAAYPNYIDPTLTQEQWQSLYFADHMTRLQQIKREVDPNNVFNFQQAIPPAASIASASGPTVPQGSQGFTFTIPRWWMVALLYLSLDIVGISGILLW